MVDEKVLTRAVGGFAGVNYNHCDGIDVTFMAAEYGDPDRYEVSFLIGVPDAEPQERVVSDRGSARWSAIDALVAACVGAPLGDGESLALCLSDFPTVVQADRLRYF